MTYKAKILTKRMTGKEYDAEIARLFARFDSAGRDGDLLREITAVRLTARGVLEWADLAGACGRKWVVSI